MHQPSTGWVWKRPAATARSNAVKHPVQAIWCGLTDLSSPTLEWALMPTMLETSTSDSCKTEGSGWTITTEVPNWGSCARMSGNETLQHETIGKIMFFVWLVRNMLDIENHGRLNTCVFFQSLSFFSFLDKEVSAFYFARIAKYTCDPVWWTFYDYLY